MVETCKIPSEAPLGELPAHTINGSVQEHPARSTKHTMEKRQARSTVALVQRRKRHTIPCTVSMFLRSPLKKRGLNFQECVLPVPCVRGHTDSSSAIRLRPEARLSSMSMIQLPCTFLWKQPSATVKDTG